MKISKLYEEKDTVFSCEVFPPKPDKSINYDTFRSLQNLNPDFISVTYGAGGGTKEKTVEVVDTVKNKFNIETLMHLTCIDSNFQSIGELLNILREKDIENILALRGDIPDGKSRDELVSDFCYASDLVKYINKNNGFSLGVAGYPEKHPQAPSFKEDIENLKYKIDCGADFIITQLFFNNDDFYRFIEKIRDINIDVPVSAGIMPVFSENLVKKMVQMCGASIPDDLKSLIEKYGSNPRDMEKAGTDYAAGQVTDLLKSGSAQGIHLYIMNRASLAEDIIKKSGFKDI
ncbi:MAG: methylenetetrahydrofolate reductase [NAD(P)H] [Elusimicrobiota bacterium]